MDRVKDIVTYPGITLDGRLDFSPHCIGNGSKNGGRSGSLEHVTSKLSCPEYRVRQLYINVIQSMVLHVSLIWSRNLKKEGEEILNSIQILNAI